MKKLLLSLFILSISTTAFSEPVNHYTEKIINPDNSVTMEVFSYPKYYEDSGNLAPIDTNIQPSGDLTWDWEVSSGVYKVRIKDDGTFEVNHLGDIINQKLIGLGFFNSATKQRVVRSNLVMSDPIVIGNTITWALPLGSTYQLIYIEDTFKDILTLSEQAKQWLKARKPNGWKVADMWIGLIYDMDLTGSAFCESTDFETNEDINFLSNGKIKHKIKRKSVQHSDYQEPEHDSQGNLLNAGKQNNKIWVKKKFYRNGKYVEAIPVLALDSDNGTLIFNTDISFQEGTDAYAGAVDALMRGGASATTNYDGGTTIQAKGNTCCSGDYERAAVITFDISDIPDTATIDSATLAFTRTNDDDGTTDVYLYEGLRDFVEAEVTFTIYSTGNNWTTAGAKSDGNDLEGTAGSSTGALATHAISGSEVSGDVITYGSTAAMVTHISDSLAGDSALYVLHQKTATGINNQYASSDNATTADRPKLSVSYTPAASSFVPKIMIY